MISSLQVREIQQTQRPMKSRRTKGKEKRKRGKSRKIQQTQRPMKSRRTKGKEKRKRGKSRKIQQTQRPKVEEEK
jgi:hypothetical protein